MEESKEIEVTEELLNESVGSRNGSDGPKGIGSNEKDKVQNGGGDNIDQPSKIKSKVSLFFILM